MDEQKLQETLVEAIIEFDFSDEDGNGVFPNGVYTFEDAGVLTMNKGVEVSFSDGSKFQITIVRSR